MYKLACCVRGYNVLTARLVCCCCGGSSYLQTRVGKRSRDTLWPSKKTRQLPGVYLRSCRLFARCSREDATPLQGGLEGLLLYAIICIGVHGVDHIKYSTLLTNFHVLHFRTSEHFTKIF